MHACIFFLIFVFFSRFKRVYEICIDMTTSTSHIQHLDCMPFGRISSLTSDKNGRSLMEYGVFLSTYGLTFYKFDVAFPVKRTSIRSNDIVLFYFGVFQLSTSSRVRKRNVNFSFTATTGNLLEIL